MVKAMTSRLAANQLNELTTNLLLSRTAWLQRQLDPRRDIGAECGHPENILTSDYNLMFERGDIARRVVNLYPEESWSESPDVVEVETKAETNFEKEWKALEDKLRIWSVLQRVDVLSGIGRYGIVLLGFGDGKPMNEPVEGKTNQLLYLRPFEEFYVDVSTLEQDDKNPRFGLPNVYNIRFVDTASQQGVTQQAKAIAAHWTRVIHVADNRTNSDVYGTPRMKWVFNRLLDLRKIAGGSGEMFWKGGFPGIALEAAVPGENVQLDKEATQAQIDAYQNGLQRYLALVGMTAKSLAPQVADPTPHMEAQLRLIAAAMSCPWRVFMGSEQGQLASGQDDKTWNRRVQRRREEYVTPFIIRPLFERLMEFGALPISENYEVKWSDPNTPSDEEKASVAERKANALFKYVTGGVDALLPPFQFLTMVIGLTDEEANGVLRDAGDRLLELDAPTEPDTPLEPLPAPARSNGGPISRR